MWIYKTVNKINEKIYVGQTHFKRESYFGSGTLIFLAISKYGIENFEKIYIDEAKTQEELDKKEIYWIDKLNAQDKTIGYNIADGGWNAFTMNDYVKKKISKTLKGKYVGDKAFRKGLKITQEHKDAISKANKGKVVSEETRKRISESSKGKVVSEETRKRISESSKGKVLSELTKKKISESNIGRIVTEEMKTILKQKNINKQQQHSIPVLARNIETSEKLEFNNMSQAARFFNTYRGKIKDNKIKGWNIILNKPITDIKLLRNNESKSNSMR